MRQSAGNVRSKMEMKKMVFMLAVLGFLGGCAGNSKPDFKVAVQGGEEKTPPLKIRAEQQMPVEIKTPVEIEARQGKVLPVEVKTPIEIRAQDGRRLPVDVDIQGDKGLPVKNGALQVSLREPPLAVVTSILAVAISLTAMLVALSAKRAGKVKERGPS